MRPHTLSPQQEELMALSGKALDTSARTFGALNNADLAFKPPVDSKGQENPLSNGTYLTYSVVPIVRSAVRFREPPPRYEGLRKYPL